MLRPTNVKLIATLILTTLIMPFTLNAQSVEEILKSHFKAVGNEKFEKTETITATGSISFMGQEAPMSMYYKKPDKICTVVSIMGMDMTSAFNGKTGFMAMPGQPVKELTAEESKELNSSNALQDRLAEAKKNKSKITLVGKTKLDSSNVFKIQVIDDKGDSTFAFIDPTTWYVVKLVTNKTLQGQTAQIEESFSDFRTTDGITLAYNIATNGMGQQADLKMDKVIFNAPIDDKQFEKPQQ